MSFEEYGRCFLELRFIDWIEIELLARMLIIVKDKIKLFVKLLRSIVPHFIMVLRKWFKEGLHNPISLIVSYKPPL